MKKILLLLVLQAILFTNTYAELIIKIDKAEIGALPMMIHVEGSSEKYLPARFFQFVFSSIDNNGGNLLIHKYQNCCQKCKWNG